MVTGTIKDIAFRAVAAGLENPAVIVFGEVVNLNPAMIHEKIKRSSANQAVVQIGTNTATK